ASLGHLASGEPADQPLLRIGPASGAIAPTSDVRFLGPGMVGPDVPHWPMFRHDAARTGRNGVARSTPPTLRWRYQTQGEVWSSAAVGIDGSVYVGSLDHRIYAIADDGSLKWAYESFGPIWSSPAIAGDGTVYIGSIDQNLYALKNGVLKWSLELGNCAFSSPLLTREGTVYVGSNDRKLHAVAYDGKLRFSVRTDGGV